MTLPTGVILAVLPALALMVAFYSASGDERELWWRARRDAMTFCRDLSDHMDELLVTASLPLKDSVPRPPIPTSMLCYLRDCFDQDLLRCHSAWAKTHTLHPYQISPQIKEVCGELHFQWESITGFQVAIIKGKNVLPVDDLRAHENALEELLWGANNIRTRITLMHKELDEARPANRFVAFVRLHLGWDWQRGSPTTYRDNTGNRAIHALLG